MSYIVAKRLQQSKDGALVNTDLQDYYMENGALFNLVSCISLELPADAKSEMEILSGGKAVRWFGAEISTLADKFNIVLYELPPRGKGDLSSTGHGNPAARVFSPNRVDLKEFPLDAVRLVNDKYDIVAWSSSTSYAEDAYVRHEGMVFQSDSSEANTGVPGTTGSDWDEVGAVVDIKQILLEQAPSGGPARVDSGGLIKRGTQALLNTENHNYMIEVHNISTATTVFSISSNFGVPSLIDG